MVDGLTLKRYLDLVKYQAVSQAAKLIILSQDLLIIGYKMLLMMVTS